MSLTIILIIIILIPVLGIIYIFNTLIAARQNVSESWADIDVQLKRRHDLIPNLVSTVKGYASHEEKVFESVAQIRSQIQNTDPKNIQELSTLEKQLESGVSQLLAVSENYPELKANENFLSLQEQLKVTEDEIASARRIYNDNVAVYNTKISTIPNTFVAQLGHFTTASFFQQS